MASRKRYRLDQVAVEPGEVRRAKWTFAKGGRQAPVRGNEHLYTVTDGNLAGRNKWEFLVRVPDDSDGRVEVRPRIDTPDPHLESADLPLAPIPEGHQGRGARQAVLPRCRSPFRPPDARRTIPAEPAPRTSSGATSAAIFPSGSRALQGRMRTKERVRSTRGTDGNTLVILVNPDDHAMMIRLYFAMKVWVLKEGIELE